jgi:transcriptional regulator with XRE-family HTH domain
MHRWDAVDNDWLLSADSAAERAGLQVIAHAVKRGRLNSGLSQRQLAYRVGLNQSTISRLESGRLRNMRMVTLARVIGVVRMPDAYLLMPGEPPPPSRRMPGQQLAM